MIKFILRSVSKIQALAFLHRNQNLYIVITIFSSTIASMISFYPLKKVTYVTLIQSEIMKNIPLFEKKNTYFKIYSAMLRFSRSFAQSGLNSDRLNLAIASSAILRFGWTGCSSIR